MSKSDFPNHEGGVIRVNHSERWGAVPEALLEDERLGLDSRAVASWLAIKPSGWQIIVSVLRRRLRTVALSEATGDVVCRELTNDRWRRIAKELEAAGYLTREKIHGRSGRWTWHITFNPRPPLHGVTVAGFSSDGEAGAGSASAGRPSVGKTSDKGKPLKKNTTEATTTTEASQKRSATNDRAAALAAEVVVSKYAERHRDVLLRLAAGAALTHTETQEIADELSGALEAVAEGRHPGIRNVRGWITKMITGLRDGGFAPDFGIRVVATRNAPAARSDAPPTQGSEFGRESARHLRRVLRYVGPPEGGDEGAP